MKVPRPICAVCNKPVDNIVQSYSPLRCGWSFTAFCHGSAEEMFVDDRSFRLARELLQGVAFEKQSREASTLCLRWSHDGE